MTTVTKIAITGPESTGKSQLCEQLAAHYQSTCVPEVAREYMENLQGSYRQQDILRIAKMQIAREKQAEKGAKELLFCDTELIVTKIWEQYKYQTCHPWILDQIKKNRYDLYLLCDVDLPWEPDPLREHPDKREFFFNWFRKELEDYGFPYRIIGGQKGERLANAIHAIDAFMFSEDE